MSNNAKLLGSNPLDVRKIFTFFSIYVLSQKSSDKVRSEKHWNLHNQMENFTDFFAGRWVDYEIYGGKSTRLKFTKFSIKLNKISGPENFYSLLYPSFPFISLKYTHL